MELTAEEKSVLEQVYGKIFQTAGYNPNRVASIRELTEDESKFFERKNFVSPHFCVQTLYKVKGDILPIQFNRAVKNLIAADENFRSNFCTVGERTVKLVFEKRENVPEVLFRVLNLDAAATDEMLTKILEADRRLDFDIQRGNLIRFSAFRTARDEFAVLISISQLISKRFNSDSFFDEVFQRNHYKKIEPRADATVPNIEARVREYWEGILKDLPAMPKIPYSKKISGSYKEEIFRAKIPGDILSDLRGHAQSNRIMLMAILQTAWGFLLQIANKSADVTFCQLVSANKPTQNLPLNLIPVRLKSSKSSTVEDIVTQQFKQLVVSQPYSFFDWSALEISSVHRKKLFDHFLSFLDFKSEEQTYSQFPATENGTVVSRHSWDAQGMPLGVYFQYTKTNLAVSFQYDKNQFLLQAGERLAKMYNAVLQRMLMYWNLNFEEFVEGAQKVTFLDMSVTDGIVREDDRKIIADFITQNTILQGQYSGTTNVLTEHAKLITRFEGDRLFGDILDNNLIFVVEGKLSRNLDTGDGWFNALDIIKAGGLINETVFLPNRRATISAEVLTEKAVLMVISLEGFESATRHTSTIYKSVLRHVLRQMEKYQTLWLQS